MKELLNNQINSFRTLNTKAGILIAFTAIFIPLFLFLVENVCFPIRIAAIILVILMIIGIVLLMLTLRSHQLYEGYDEETFEDLINLEIENVYLTEIAYNKDSIINNDKTLKIRN